VLFQAGFMPSFVTANATTLWDGVNTGPNMIIEDGGLGARLGATVTQKARSLASAASGKYYFELTLTAAAVAANVSVGVMNVSAAFTSYLGSSNDEFGWAGDGSIVYNNAVQGSPINTYIVGDILCCAFNFSTDKFWGRRSRSGTPTGWNNDVIGNQDPANAIGGISFSTINAGPYYIAISEQSSGDKFNLNAGGSAYAQTPPTNFINF
jgi:hypothetical protein